MKTIAFVALFVAASCVAPSSSVEQALVAPSSCFDPAAFGAVPNDGVDDRFAVQASLDAVAAFGGGRVCLGAGVFDLTRAPPGEYNRFAALSIRSRNVELVGAGRFSTILAMGGDQGAAATYVVSIDPGADGVAISDLGIDTTAMSNTSEQTHAVAIGTGVCDVNPCTKRVSNVTLERVRLVHPKPADGSRKGDCVKALGNTEAMSVVNARLIGVDFLSCARSGITIQRNVLGMTIDASYFDGDHIEGTMVDGEATGGGWDRRLAITGTTFVRTLPGGDSYAVTLTSQTNYQITGNTFVGRGLFAYRTTDGTIGPNTFDCTDCVSAGVIELRNQAERIAIGGNTIRRRGSPGNGIHLSPQSGGFPTGIAIVGNVVVNETDGACVYAHSISDAIVANNLCVGDGAPGVVGLYVAAISRPVELVVATGNAFRGFGYAAVLFGAGYGYGFSGTSVSANVSASSGPMKCPAVPMGLVHTPNAWSAGDACAAQ